ncbi:hypothetical protein [Pseudoalteromonas rubra]|jgi:hypothetical protein|uniref:hypothetical protein n=1 Tax=Pseudoalteromonas rubra TaxID=43658 RepID=UPI000F793371|nr:hypothetical protein [Pseudoalteromonas rubra]
MKKNAFLSDQDAYRTLLDIYSSEQINQKICNDFFEHSSSVYERFFLDCNMEVFIFARGIKEEIFNIRRVKDALEHFLSKTNSKVTMILRAKDLEEAEELEEHDAFVHCAYKYLVKHNLEKKGKFNITFYQGDKDWLEDVPSITIGDDRMYRKRYSKERNVIKNTGKAIVNFSDPEYAKELREKISSATKSLEVLKTTSL